MLPTFVIGLREGVEAALIVAIIAGFLRQEGRRDALRPMWLGVGAAVAICLAAGIALELLDQELPQRQQEGLETVVGIAAVGIVTFMIVWMRRHARGLSGQLRAQRRRGAGGRLDRARWWRWRSSPSSARGWRPSSSCSPCSRTPTTPATAGIGAMLGLAAAVAIGFAIYRGGVKLNLRALLPHHRRRARARRRRAGRQHAAHRARGGLAQRRPGPGARPHLAGRAGHVDRRRC